VSFASSGGGWTQSTGGTSPAITYEAAPVADPGSAPTALHAQVTVGNGVEGRAVVYKDYSLGGSAVPAAIKATFDVYIAAFNGVYSEPGCELTIFNDSQMLSVAVDIERFESDGTLHVSYSPLPDTEPALQAAPPTAGWYRAAVKLSGLDKLQSVGSAAIGPIGGALGPEQSAGPTSVGFTPVTLEVSCGINDANTTGMSQTVDVWVANLALETCN
jgi:hypothetical protein